MPLYEFDKYEPHLNRRGTLLSGGGEYVPFRNAAKRAFLLWGEHCTECAAPDCFSTCQLYQSRPDRRCRRFEFGLFPNSSFPTGYGRAAEVVFKRWALLSARANATMLPAAWVSWIERIAASLHPLTNLVGRLAGQATGDIRYSYLTFVLMDRLNAWLLRRHAAARPDAFVFECYNPGSFPLAVQFLMSVDRKGLPASLRVDQLPPPFVTKFIVGPGYFRQDIPFSFFNRIVESGLAFGMSIAPDAGEGAHLIFLALDLIVYADAKQPRPQFAPASLLTTIAPALPAAAVSHGARPQAKCVVFDLDHTLWAGVLLEGNVRLRPGVPELLDALDSRGILLSIASKNSHDHASGKLAELGIEEYFLYPRINWDRKSDNLKAIARDLDIGIDTFLFVDDSPFERDEVSASLPQVEVLDETAVDRLLAHPRLIGSTSAEAKVRRQMYRQSMVRSAAAKEFAEDYTGFLRSCHIRLEIRPPGDADRERVFELVQRTNQLNFSGTKYAAEEITAALADPAVESYVLECSDKYGLYGIVGFCMARRSREAVRVADFMLSCRVQGKYIEQALFDFLISQEPRLQRLEVCFKRTNRNAPAEAVLKKLGFDTSGNEGVLARSVAPGDLAVDYMEVITRQTAVSGRQ